jgi:hypothetical protein
MTRPQPWRSLQGRRHRTRLLWGLCFALVGPSLGQAATSWVSIRDVSAPGHVRIDSGGLANDYVLLRIDEPAVFQVRGPRQVKIIARYLFTSDEADGQPFGFRVLVDGSETLRKSFTGRIHSETHLAGDPQGAVSALRRGYVDVGTGLHTLQVYSSSSGAGRIAARFFQISRRSGSAFVPFAPESYGAVCTLQFESGSHSTYYHFDASAPLIISVMGPTTLRVYTRLDFDYTMNGSQTYSLEVLANGKPWKSFHYHTHKLSGAAYVERPEVLPGSRKLMRIPVPRGPQHYEIRCLRPEGCGVTAQVQLPKADLSQGNP